MGTLLLLRPRGLKKSHCRSPSVSQPSAAKEHTPSSLQLTGAQSCPTSRTALGALKAAPREEPSLLHAGEGKLSASSKPLRWFQWVLQPQPSGLASSSLMASGHCSGANKQPASPSTTLTHLQTCWEGKNQVTIMKKTTVTLEAF